MNRVDTNKSAGLDKFVFHYAHIGQEKSYLKHYKMVPVSIIPL